MDRGARRLKRGRRATTRASVCLQRPCSPLSRAPALMRARRLHRPILPVTDLAAARPVAAKLALLGDLGLGPGAGGMRSRQDIARALPASHLVAPRGSFTFLVASPTVPAEKKPRRENGRPSPRGNTAPARR